MCLIDIKHASTLNISSTSGNTGPCLWSLPSLCTPGRRRPRSPPVPPALVQMPGRTPLKAGAASRSHQSGNQPFPHPLLSPPAAQQKNVNVQRSRRGLRAVFVGDAEALLKQKGSFRSFSADFCHHELLFNHGKCQHLLLLADPKFTHSSKGKRSALLAWAIKGKKTGDNFSLGNLWQFRKNLSVSVAKHKILFLTWAQVLVRPVCHFLCLLRWKQTLWNIES